MYTTVEDFPPEILSIITASLQSKKDLKSLRLITRAFHDAAVPQLFDSIFIIARYADLEIASRVALRFGSFVKKILLSSECYMPVASVEHYLRMAESRSEQMKALCPSEEEVPPVQRTSCTCATVADHAPTHGSSQASDAGYHIGLIHVSQEQRQDIVTVSQPRSTWGEDKHHSYCFREDKSRLFSLEEL